MRAILGVTALDSGSVRFEGREVDESMRRLPDAGRSAIAAVSSACSASLKLTKRRLERVKTLPGRFARRLD